MNVDHGGLCWTDYFLECQGYNVPSTIMYQNNQSAIILENNGRASCSKITKHLNIRYFYHRPNQKGGPSYWVLSHWQYGRGFFTKPLQGKKFLRFIKLIMNLQDWNLPWPKECVGNQILSYYINCPMFGFQSHLPPVLFWIHKWIIWCSTLIILTSLFDIPSLFDISSPFDIFLRLSSIYWFFCLQRRENYLQLLYNLFHIYSVY